MKKIILAAVLAVASFAQAQITVTTNGGATISDGQVFTYNSLGEATAKMKISVTNGTAESHKFTIRVDELKNNTVWDEEDGGAGDLQLCFGDVCYPALYEGNLYPSAGYDIPAGESNVAADHFYNSYAGDTPGETVEYVFTILQIDDIANPVEIVSFRYVYAATAGINDLAGLEKIGIAVTNTVIKNNMQLTATQNADMQIFGINGQIVKSTVIATGSQSIDLSDLAAGVYIAKFTTEQKKTSQVRIVKN